MCPFIKYSLVLNSSYVAALAYVDRTTSGPTHVRISVSGVGIKGIRASGKTRQRPDKKVSPGFEKYCMYFDNIPVINASV